METQFYVLLSLKTRRGFEDYGQYFIGDDRQVAYALFSQLKGDPQMNDACLLHLDLMETAGAVPVKIKTVCCTLEDLGANCKLIAREVFRLKNLEEI
jgi:hypothetical protein